MDNHMQSGRMLSLWDGPTTTTPSSRTLPSLRTLIDHVPYETRENILAHVIGGYADQHPQTASPVSKEEYHPQICEGGRYPGGYHLDKPEPPPARCKYVRVRKSEDRRRDPLLFFDVHNCRDPAPGIREGLRAVLYLLDYYPNETVQLVRADPGLRSAELDVFYVEGVGMWTRWLRLPAVATRHFDTLRIRVRASIRLRWMVQEAEELLKSMRLIEHEAEFSMLPSLLSSVWQLGLLSAWGYNVVGRSNTDRFARVPPSGSFRRVVVDVVPVRLDEMRKVPTRLCGRCGTLIMFVNPTSKAAKDQEGIYDDDFDGAEGSESDEGGEGNEGGEGSEGPEGGEGNEGPEGSGGTAESGPSMADPDKIAREFLIGLKRYVKNEEHGASLRQTFAQVEIQSEGSVLEGGVVRLSNPLDFHREERAVTENEVRYLHERLEKYLDDFEVERQKRRKEARATDRHKLVCCD